MTTELIEIPKSLAQELEGEAQASRYGGDPAAVINEALTSLYALQELGITPKTRAFRIPRDFDREAEKIISKKCDLGEQKLAWANWLKTNMGDRPDYIQKETDERFKTLIVEYQDQEFAASTEIKTDLIRLIGVIDSLHTHTQHLLRDSIAPYLMKTRNRDGIKTTDQTLAMIMMHLRTFEKYTNPKLEERTSAKRDRALSFILGLLPICRDAEIVTTSTNPGPFYEMVIIGLSAIGHRTEDPKRLILDALKTKTRIQEQFESFLAPKPPR